MTDQDSSTHRELRELHGAYALRALDDATRTRLRAHLDGCPGCRAELAEIAPVVDALRGVDPDAVSTGQGVLPAPPPDLGERVVVGLRIDGAGTAGGGAPGLAINRRSPGDRETTSGVTRRPPVPIRI